MFDIRNTPMVDVQDINHTVETMRVYLENMKTLSVWLSSRLDTLTSGEEDLRKLVYEISELSVLHDTLRLVDGYEDLSFYLATVKRVVTNNIINPSDVGLNQENLINFVLMEIDQKLLEFSKLSSFYLMQELLESGTTEPELVNIIKEYISNPGKFDNEWTNAIPPGSNSLFNVVTEIGGLLSETPSINHLESDQTLILMKRFLDIAMMPRK